MTARSRSQDIAWLTARPIAHRGLHAAAQGVVENTASAVSAAVAGNYGIEVDLQVSADGEAMVHHDDALGRLTEGRGQLRDLPSAALRRIAFKAAGDRMMSLGELLDLVAGRATLVLELKSRFDGDLRLVERTAALLSAYRGPAAVMSFDPTPITALRHIAPDIARGITAQRWYRRRDWGFVSAARRCDMAFFMHASSTRPDFIAYQVAELAGFVPRAARHMFGRPLLTWTVRTQEQRRKAGTLADQIIFEGFAA